MPRVCRFTFPERVTPETVEAQLVLAIIAAECFFGKARVRISAAYFFASRDRRLVIDVGTDVGEFIAALFTGFVSRQVGETGFTVDRIERAKDQARGSRAR